MAAAAARILSQPLAFQGSDVPAGTDPAQLRRLSQQAVPVERLVATTDAHDFAYRATGLELPDLRLVACANAPLEVQVGQRQRAVVVLPFGGRGECLQQGRRLPLVGSTGLVYLTGEAYRVRTDYLNSAFFDLDLERLRRTAQAMAPAGLQLAQLEQRINTPQLLRGDQPLEAELLRQLRRTLSLLDLPLLSGSPLFGALGIDELIYRQLAQLLCLGSPSDPILPHQRERHLQERILDDLLAWIEANLDRPLRLADLQRHSSYSVRMLQTVFRRRCGCSPMQWVRHARMARALQLLQTPTVHSTVLSVAEACGYTSRAAFSRDFQQVHGECASHVLRQARRRLQQLESV